MTKFKLTQILTKLKDIEKESLLIQNKQKLLHQEITSLKNEVEQLIKTETNTESIETRKITTKEIEERLTGTTQKEVPLQKIEEKQETEQVQQKKIIVRKLVKQKQVEKELKGTKPQPKQSSGTSLENIFGTKIVSYIGIAMLLIGIAIGLIYSYKYIPPTVRILLGYITSVVMGVLAIRLHKQEKYEVLSGVILGGSVVVAMSSNFAATGFYNFYGIKIASVLYFIISVAGFYLSYVKFKLKVTPHIIVWLGYFIPLFTGYYKNIEDPLQLQFYTTFANIIMFSFLTYEFRRDLFFSTLLPNIIIGIIIGEKAGFSPVFFSLQYFMIIFAPLMYHIYRKKTLDKDVFYINFHYIFSLVFMIMLFVALDNGFMQDFVARFKEIPPGQLTFFDKLKISSYESIPFFLVGIISLIVSIPAGKISETIGKYTLGISVGIISLFLVKLFLFKKPFNYSNLSWLIYYFAYYSLSVGLSYKKSPEKLRKAEGSFIITAIFSLIIFVIVWVSTIKDANIIGRLLFLLTYPALLIFIYKITSENIKKISIWSAVFSTYLIGIGMVLYFYEKYSQTIPIAYKDIAIAPAFMTYTVVFLFVLGKLLKEKHLQLRVFISETVYILGIIVMVFYAWKLTYPNVPKKIFVLYEGLKVLNLISMIGIIISYNIKIKLGKYLLRDIYIFLVAFIYVTFELVALANRLQTDYLDRAVISIAWGIIILIFIYLGITRRKQIWRILSIVLTGALVLKIFFYDIAKISTGKKIVVFILTGAALLLVGYFYQKYGSKLRDEEEK